MNPAKTKGRSRGAFPRRVRADERIPDEGTAKYAKHAKGCLKEKLGSRAVHPDVLSGPAFGRADLSSVRRARVGDAQRRGEDTRALPPSTTSRFTVGRGPDSLPRPATISSSRRVGSGQTFSVPFRVFRVVRGSTASLRPSAFGRLSEFGIRNSEFTPVCPSSKSRIRCGP